MLPVKTVTKKQKKEASKKRTGIFLIFIGLVLIVVSLFYTTFFEDVPKPISPLSRNQTSVNSIIEKTLKSKNIPFISIETSKDLSLIIKLSKDNEVVIDPNKDIDQQLSSLQLILSQLKIEGKLFKRLDFRYQKPIISF